MKNSIAIASLVLVTSFAWADEDISIMTQMSYGVCQLDDQGSPESCQVTVGEMQKTTFTLKKSGENDVDGATAEVMMDEEKYHYCVEVQMHKAIDEKGVTSYWFSPTARMALKSVGEGDKVEHKKLMEDKIAIVTFGSSATLNDILFFSPAVQEDKVVRFIGFNVGPIKEAPALESPVQTQATLVRQLMAQRPELKKAKIIVNKSAGMLSQ